VQSQTEVVFGTGALLNVIEVCIAHILLFRFYEHSRASAYKQLRLRNAEIITLSETDKLTQLFNRDKLDKAFSAIAQHSAKNKQPLSVIMLDIDHFKKINDEHGHLEGDRVLSELATELNAMMRKHDLLARWGGEEFMVLLQDTPLSIAQELAQRLRIRISEKPLSNKQVTVSVGVGEYAPPESTDAFFERVDAALYKAKRNGRNQVSVAQ
jgi:diguanylate cyclase (GGDEF)-like protein